MREKTALVEKICILCPTSCRLRVRGREGQLQVRGAACERGVVYAESEFVEPMRMFTGTVRVSTSRQSVVSVKTDRPVPRDIVMDVARAAAGVRVKAPVTPGQIVAENLPGGARLLATSAATAGEPRADRT